MELLWKRCIMPGPGKRWTKISTHSNSERELRFQTLINGKRVNVKFDLRKMTYKGKLEN